MTESPPVVRVVQLYAGSVRLPLCLLHGPIS
jgi:hypothetical protein